MVFQPCSVVCAKTRIVEAGQVLLDIYTPNPYNMDGYVAHYLSSCWSRCRNAGCPDDALSLLSGWS